MKGFINGFDFLNIEIQKYYSPPKSWSEEKIKKLTTERIFSGDWVGSRKRDGAFYMFIFDEDGNYYLRGRSKNVKGEYLDKYEWVPHLHPFFKEINKGTVFLGELYLPKDEQAKTTTSYMNCLVDKAIKRQEKEENRLHYYIFDILAENGKSCLDKTAEERFDILNSFSHTYSNKYIEWAQYYKGKELWDFMQKILADNGEGVVITKKDSYYQPGKRPSTQCLKVKKELQETIDCIVIGANPPSREYNGKEIETWQYWFDERKGLKLQGDYYIDYLHGAPIIPLTKAYFMNWAGSLKLGLYKEDKLIHIGNLSGITDEIKKDWRNYLGKVVEVGAMEVIHGDGGTLGLRHPKFLQWREDKVMTECLYSQLEQ